MRGRYGTTAGRAIEGGKGLDSPKKGRVRSLSRSRVSATTAILAVALIVAAAHVAAVWSSYHPLSFYDDAHYLLLARNLGDGIGLVDTSKLGNPADTVYPPGYPLLLAPLTIVFGDALNPLRLLSLICFLSVLVLTAFWLRERGERRLVVVGGTLLVLALNPMGATYGSMIMAEMPFLLALMGALVAALRWERQERAATLWGVATIVALTAAIYIKSAGLLLLPGVVLYFAGRRRWTHALACLAGPIALYAPLLLRNALVGAPLEGEAYGSQISVLRGGPDLVLREAWHAIERYARSAFGYAIVDSRPFAGGGPIVGTLLDLLRLAALPLVAFGAFLAGRRRLDPSLVAVPIYLLGTLAYPYTNERRLILVLPIIVYWAVGGLAGICRLAIELSTRRFADRPGRRLRRLEPAFTGLLVAAVLVVPVAPQFGRDYRFLADDAVLDPLSTPALAILRAAGRPEVPVAARSVYAAHLVTGHKTVRLPGCQEPASLWKRFGALGAGFAAIGDYRRPPGAIDDPCQVHTMNGQPNRYVVLYRDSAEPTVTYQLVGPGSPFPRLADAMAGRRLVARVGRAEQRTAAPLVPSDPAPPYLILEPRQGRGSAAARFPAGEVVQLSVAAAGTPGAAPESIDVALHTSEGWRLVSRVEGENVGPVGERPPPDEALPFLLVKLSPPVRADGVRITFEGSGPFEVRDLHVLVQTRP